MKPRGVGFLLLGALGGAAVASWERDRQKARQKKTPAPAPPLIAYLYRQPGEIAIRMSVGTSPATAVERGIFATLDKAQDVARSSGFTLAWDGAKDL